MAKKYIKNEKGIIRAVTSDNLQLEKPLLNENYDIEVHNRNMDKIDSAIQEVKGKIDGLELVASNVKMADGTTVEDTVSANKTSILNNTNLANNALNKANEAFQRGDNVKTQLVDKLISEGLDVSTNNTFEELINGIALGKKFASGIYADKITLSSSQGRAWVAYRINFSVEFTPSVLFLSIDEIPSAVAKKITINSIYANSSTNFFGVGKAFDIYSSYLKCYIENLSSSGFDMYIEFNGNSNFINGFTWYAFE